jgi:hypothetical protein
VCAPLLCISTPKTKIEMTSNPVGGHTPVGLTTAGGLAEIAAWAGVLGTAATWVASTGSRAAGREAQTPRLVGACERRARVFLGGALRCLACSKSPSQKKNAHALLVFVVGGLRCVSNHRIASKKGG